MNKVLVFLLVVITMSFVSALVVKDFFASKKKIEDAYGQQDGCNDLKIWCDYPDGMAMTIPVGLCFEKRGETTFFFKCEKASVMDKVVLWTECLDYSKPWICRGDLVLATDYSIDSVHEKVIAKGVRFSIDDKPDTSYFVIDSSGIDSEHVSPVELKIQDQLK